MQNTYTEDFTDTKKSQKHPKVDFIRFLQDDISLQSPERYTGDVGPFRPTFG